MFVEEEIGYSKAYRINDTRLIGFVHQTAMQLNDPTLRRYPSFRFPATMPVTIERRHVSIIRSSQYMFTPKADGLRVLVVLFKYYHGGDWQNMCVMLQRDGTCHLITQEFPTDAYENAGSLFDAELVNSSSAWSVLQLFDCYSYNGTNMRSLPLLRRLARCDTLAACPQSATCTLRVAKKAFFKLTQDHIPDMKAFISNSNHTLDYDTDGIVLVPAGRCKSTFGRDETQFKVKPHHTIDLIVAYDDEDKMHYLASYDETTDCFISKMEVDPKAHNLEVNMVVECSILLKPENVVLFAPLKPRLDKNMPNSEVVLERTLNTIREDVKVEELVAP